MRWTTGRPAAFSSRRWCGGEICLWASPPGAAVWLKEQIEGLLPEHTEEILTWLEGQRPILKERLPHQRERAACFARLFAACLTLGRPLTEQERERELGEDTYG